MMNDQFEKAKALVAKKHGFSCWEWALDGKGWDGVDDLYREVFESIQEEQIDTIEPK